MHLAGDLRDEPALADPGLAGDHHDQCATGAGRHPRLAQHLELADVGDRIEVSNALWEWVQDEGPCSRQWFVCTVLQVNEVRNGEDIVNSCIIRLINTGMEYEIQGIYQWNRYYWRWLQR